MAPAYSHDVLIIGSGGAGLSLALRLPASVQVAVIAKGQLNEGCTLYAQSCGLHYTLDYPQADTSKPPADTILTPPLAPVGESNVYGMKRVK